MYYHIKCLTRKSATLAGTLTDRDKLSDRAFAVITAAEL